MKFETDDWIVECKDDPATKEAVFNAVIQFFKDHQMFSGESIMQSDNPQIEAPILMSNIADDILKFNVKYKDEE